MDFINTYESSAGPTIQINILGTGPFLEALEKRAADTKRVDVKFFRPGEISVLDVLLMSEATLLLSEAETFSLVSCESLACGKPVIGFDCGGPRDFVNDSLSVLLKTRSMQELVNVSAALVEKWNTLNTSVYQAECRNSVLRYTAENITKSLLDYYRGRLQNPSGP